MKLTCEDARDRLLETRGDLPVDARELRAHLETCAACSDLANRTAFRMTKAEAGELPADLAMIVIRFELE